jgi:hypothetical protein
MNKQMDWFISYRIWKWRQEKEIAECEKTNKQMDWLISYRIWSWKERKKRNSRMIKNE